MKKHFKNYVIILFITSILMIPLLTNQYHVGHDTKFHIANVLAVKEQFQNGNFMCPILPHIANNFGYGTRLFYPVLPHVVTAGIGMIIEFKTNDITHAFIIVHFLTILLAALSMYHCANRFSKNTSLALLSAILYITMPYFLSNIYRRCALAESFIFIFIPIILSGVLALLAKKKQSFYPLFIIGYIGAFLSHFTMTIYFTMFLAVFLIIYRKETFTKDFIKPFFFATIAVILVIVPFIEPMIYHKIFGHYVVFQKGEMYKRVTTTALMPWEYFNPFPVLDANDTKYHLLIITSCLLIFTIFARKKIDFPKYSRGIVWFGFVAFFLSSALFPWIIMPSFLKMIQFPWRLVTFFSVSLSLILPLCLSFIKKHRRLIIVGVLLILTFSAYKSISFSKEEYIDSNDIWWNGGMGWQREYLPIRMKNNLQYYYQRNKDILVQSGATPTIFILDEEIPNLTFQVTGIDQQTVIELPRIFYFGYSLQTEENSIALHENSKGFLEATIEKDGIYHLRYVGTKTRKIATIVSIMTTFILIILFIKSNIHRKKLE